MGDKKPLPMLLLLLLLLLVSLACRTPGPLLLLLLLLQAWWVSLHAHCAIPARCVSSDYTSSSAGAAQSSF
jgi:hypothetical protein